MKEYYVRTSPVEFFTVLELHMELEAGKHGKLKITGYIGDEEEEKYLRLLTGDVWEKVERVDESGGAETLFLGIVTDFTISLVNDQKKLTLELMTGSCLLDESRHLYSCQEPAKTYEEIFTETVGRYQNGKVIFNSPFEEETGELVLQYWETDWAFLKRMASRKNRLLVPSITVKGAALYYDLPEGKEISLPETGACTIEKNIGRYKRMKQGGLPQLREEDCLVYRFSCREQHRLGDYALFRGKKFYVFKIVGNYTRGEMIYDYFGCPKGGLFVPEDERSEMAGCSLDAVVTRVMNDKVQVKIKEDENIGQNINIWYPYSTVYSTPDGTGWYCMPEPGDEVRLTIPGKKEKEAFITSSVHMETESGDRKNPEHKIWKNKYQKEVRLTPDSILITNNQGTKIVLKDGEGIQIVSAHSILLEAAEDITISSDSGALIASGTTSVSLKQKGTSIQMDDGISFTGGKLQVQ